MSQTVEAFSVARLRPWLMETLLPFWAETGFDREHGAFVEKFEPDGTPSTEDYTRLRVQARQIFVFSHAAHAGYSDVGLVRAQQAFAFLERHAWDRAQGGWFRRLRRSGAPLDRAKDSYDHAFMLLALAWLYRAGGDAAVLRRAEETVDFLDARLGQTRGGAFDGYAEEQVASGAALPLPRRQNPHMHLLEAFLALYEASGAARWRRQAERIYGLFERYFYEAGAGQLIEFFDRDWREAEQDGRRLREPGHHFEWAWLLHRYAALTEDERPLAALRPLFDWAWEKGLDREGAAPWIVFEELAPDGRVLNGGSKRLWPQTEAVKACLAVYERYGEEAARAGAQRLLQGLFTTFASLEAPHWREQVDRDGKLIRPGMPSSSLYHLYLATAEAVRVLPGA